MQHTSQMKAEQIARLYTQHHGWQGRSGGWIYDTDGKPILQGYWHLSEILIELGVIEEGVGIHWSKEKELTPFTNDLSRISVSMATRIRNLFNKSRGYKQEAT
jgi:hypothetical protein